MEMAWATNNDIGARRGVVRHIAKALLDEREEELTYLERDLELIANYADNPILGCATTKPSRFCKAKRER